MRRARRNCWRSQGPLRDRDDSQAGAKALVSAQGAAAMVPKKLLIVRLGAMGDVIHTLHAAARLRQSFPDSQIGWVIEERWAELLCAKGETRSGPRNSARPLVDFVHAVDTKTWRKSPLSSPTRQQFSAAIQEL